VDEPRSKSINVPLQNPARMFRQSHNKSNSPSPRALPAVLSASRSSRGDISLDQSAKTAASSAFFAALRCRSLLAVFAASTALTRKPKLALDQTAFVRLVIGPVPVVRPGPYGRHSG